MTLFGKGRGKKQRYNISSGSSWEPLRGYARAVKVDDRLIISGTTAMNSKGEVVAPGDAYSQTRYVIQLIKKILAEAGFTPLDVVLTRLFVTDMSQWSKYARAHRESFEKIRPASTIVEVSKLVDPRLVIEMEAEAIRGCELKSDLAVLRE